MALLVGNNATKTGSGTVRGANEAHWYTNGYTGVAGTAVTAYLDNNSWWTANNAKLVLCNSSGTVVAISGAIDVTSAGERTASISASVSVATYYLYGIGDGYIDWSHTGGSWILDYEADSYSSPGNITIPGSNTNYGQLRIWIDGTTGGGGPSTPQGLHGIHYGWTPQRSQRLNGELQ